MDKGISTRDKDLIRVLVSRAEIDLAAIQVEYERLFKKPLLQDSAALVEPHNLRGKSKPPRQKFQGKIMHT
ncbi:hypothetical protein ANCDUO_26720 [Ancylostoma duodenale]|uniref:Annexin n=1 Tax=Ancylostoma duodenale TaxID=51022 RepID=A0A0C2C0Y9_9BILA|nr:hypothetical protein ANCDUO_26720 [Ancylostoma duodenale]